MRTWLERLWYPRGDRGLTHALAAPPLALVSGAFSLVASARAALAAAPTRIDGARVVSVGNLTVGGAGKTPAVIFLAQLAQQHGKRVAVLTRGYGRSSTAAVELEASALAPEPLAGDEPRLIATRCPGVRVYVGADRVASARAARAAGFDLLLLDDGFQHRRLARDADLVLIDDAVGLGNGRRLPWGPLRESASALARATLVWRRSAETVGPPLHSNELHAEHRVRSTFPLAGTPVLVITGIARPSSVVESAARLGARVVATRFFADHHRFTASELAEAKAAAQALDATLLTTEKDAQRMPEGFAQTLIVDVVLRDGHAALHAALGLEGQHGA